MITDIISRIKTELINIFDEIYTWFDVRPEVLDYLPVDGGWSVRLILEHISLTNHFLLILIQKGSIKSLEKAKKKSQLQLLDSYDFNWDLMKQIGTPKLFEWNRPDHMEPSGKSTINEVLIRLQYQASQCLDILDQLKNGEGALYKTTMTVNGLGKIDVYHYVYFLVQHTRRHITQMQKVKEEFENQIIN